MTSVLVLLTLALLGVWIRADLLRVERWPVLETQAKGDIQSMLQSLKDSSFPSFSYLVENAALDSYIKIFNFQVTSLEPRIMFLKPTFYSKPNQDTYSINVPLGYHMTASFEWVYNYYAFTKSGHAVFDTDVHNLIYNITLNFSQPSNIDVSIHVNYTLVPVKKVEVFSLLPGANIALDLVGVVAAYLPSLKNATETAFTQALSTRYNNLFEKSYPITMHYSTFQYSFSKTAAISAITTRNSLVLAYGKNAIVPDEFPASSSIRRQYCVEQRLLDAVVDDVWPKMKAVFRSASLPPDSPYPLTVSGLAMFVPDVVNEFDRNAETVLHIESVLDKADVRLERLNETHAAARNFRMRLRFVAAKKPVLNVTLLFDMIVVPYEVKLGDSFTFNVRAKTALIQDDSLAIETRYRTIITSNLQEACKEYIVGLLLPYMGFALLGDGLVIKDDLTPYAHASYSIASSAICLNLAYDNQLQ